jgi:hypothetical protein
MGWPSGVGSRKVGGQGRAARACRLITVGGRPACHRFGVVVRHAVDPVRRAARAECSVRAAAGYDDAVRPAAT